MSTLVPQSPDRVDRSRRCLALLLMATGLLTAPAAAGDAVQGARLAAPCASCHGTDGRSPGEIPSINVLTADDMSRALLEFRSGSREATVMNRIARGYEIPEIEAIAAYFATKAR